MFRSFDLNDRDKKGFKLSGLRRFKYHVGRDIATINDRYSFLVLITVRRRIHRHKGFTNV